MPWQYPGLFQGMKTDQIAFVAAAGAMNLGLSSSTVKQLISAYVVYPAGPNVNQGSFAFVQAADIAKPLFPSAISAFKLWIVGGNTVWFEGVGLGIGNTYSVVFNYMY